MLTKFFAMRSIFRMLRHGRRGTRPPRGRTALLTPIIALLSVLGLVMSATPPAGAVSLGLRATSAVGAPALHVERPVGHHLALHITVGPYAMYGGHRLQLGGIAYQHPGQRGLFLSVAATWGRGETPAARWDSMQLHAAAGYAWAFHEAWRATVELGYGAERVTAIPKAGSRVVTERKPFIFGVGIAWRLP